MKPVAKLRKKAASDVGFMSAGSKASAGKSGTSSSLQPCQLTQDPDCRSKHGCCSASLHQYQAVHPSRSLHTDATPPVVPAATYSTMPCAHTVSTPDAGDQL